MSIYATTVRVRPRRRLLAASWFQAKSARAADSESQEKWCWSGSAVVISFGVRGSNVRVQYWCRWQAQRQRRQHSR